MAYFAQVGAGARSDGSSDQQGAAFDPFASQQYSRPAELPAEPQPVPEVDPGEVFVTVPQVRQVEMHYAPATDATAASAPFADASTSAPYEAAEYTQDTGYDGGFDAGQYAGEDLYGAYPPIPPKRNLGKAPAILGAVVSVALLVGIGAWGYNLIVRDVSGIPVVSAMKGPMRVQPETPGGEAADHQGLAVNAVAAHGTAEAPADRLQLAPGPITLTEDDQPVQDLLARAPDLAADQPFALPVEPQPELITSASTDASTNANSAAGTEDQPEDQLTADLSASEQRNQDINALVATLTEGATALSDIRPTAASATLEPSAVELRAKRIQAEVAALSDAPGFKTAPRPKLRPAVFSKAPAPVAVQTSVEVAVADLAMGTRMAQLGAYESGDVARQEWARIAGQFGGFFEGKQRVVQRAESGGRIFYRLRVVGFSDLADARRFCSALVAGNADCIPVVMR